MARNRTTLARKILELIAGCVLLTAPLPAIAQTTLFSENFDSAWTTPTTLQSGTCAVPPCYWSGEGSGDTEWHRSDYTGGWTDSEGGYPEYSGPSARFNSTGAPAGSRGALLTPWLYIYGTRGPLAFSCWYINSSGTDSLFVSYSHDGVNYTRVLALGIATTWTRVWANLGQAGGYSSLRIKIEGQSDDGDSDMGMDDTAVLTGLAGVTYIGLGERLRNFAEAVAEYDSAASTGRLADAAYLATSGYEGIDGLLTLVSVPSIGGTHTVTFGPQPGVTITTSGSSPSAVWELNGADNIILDGGSGWNISNTNFASATACIWGHNGASNNTIKNVSLSCAVDPHTSTLETFCLIFSGASISNSSDGTDNDGNTIENVTALNAQWGIYFRGAFGNPNDNNVISNCTVGPATRGLGPIRRGGIIAQHQNGLTVTGCVVRNMGSDPTDTATGTDAIAYGIGSNVAPVTATVMTGARITGNRAYGIWNRKAASAIAFEVASSVTPSNNLVANNMVYDILANGTGSDQAVGILIGPGSGDVVADNSLRHYGDNDPPGTTTATQSAVGIRVATASAANLTLKGNIIVEGRTSNTGTLRQFGIVVPSPSFSWDAGGCDYNDYYADPASSQATLGGIGTVVPYTPVTTLTSWRTQFTPNQDGASISEAPPFVSATDLHIRTDVATGIEGGGTGIAGVTKDIDGDSRNPINPDIGADEGPFTPLNIAPVLREIADIVPRWGKRIVVSPIAHDRDCLPLTFSALNLPPGASIDATTGRITWQVPSCPGTSYPDITVIATDACGAADSVTFGVRPEPAFLTSCYVRPEYVPKLMAYPADANHNFVEDQLEEPAAGPAGTGRAGIRPGRGLPNVVAAGDSIPGDVILAFNMCNALVGANRDTVETRARILWESDIIPAALVRTVRANLLHLAGLHFVSMVAANHRYGAALDTSVRVLGIQPSSTYSRATVEDSLLNVDGTGQTVVIIDSGVDGIHESLQGKYQSGVSFISGTGDSTSGDPPAHWHATFTAGAAVGRGNGAAHMGVAKSALYSDVCVLVPDGSGGMVGTEVDVIAALQYATINYGPGTVVYIGIAGDNLSYGADPSVLWNGTDPLSTAITAATQLGLIVVVPVGNADEFNTPLLPPAVAEDAIVVAGSAHMGTVAIDDDQIWASSKTGPREPDPDGDTIDEEIPHIAAPGSDLPTGGTGIIAPDANTVNGYVGGSGTSVAAAQVAGLLALMQQVMTNGLTTVGARQTIEDTADPIGFGPMPAKPAAIAAQAWNPAWGHGLVNGFRVLDRLVPQCNLGFDVFCGGPGFWPMSPDIQVLDPILLGDSVRVTVTVHSKCAFRRIVGFTVEVGAYSFGNGPFQGIFHTFTDTDPLLPGEYRTFECKWYVNPGLSKPHGCLKAFIHYARDGGSWDNCAQRNVDIIGYGSSNSLARAAAGSPQARPAQAASPPPVSHMFVANVLPEDVQVTLVPTLVEGSGWALVCSESTLAFPMEKNAPPRDVTWKGVPGGAATDSSVWDVTVLEQGTCAAWNSGGGRVVARKSELAGIGDAIVPLPTLVMAPRPFRTSLEITFGLPSAGRVELRIYDVLGREVWRIDEGERPAGPVRARWDGRTHGGGDAASGIYFVRARLGGAELGGRVVRLR